MIRSLFRKFAALAILALAATGGGYAIAQVKPAAPALCVEGSCGAPPATPAAPAATGQQIKWHPGHYVRANCVGVDTPEQNGCRASAYQSIASNPHFKGGIINVTWAMLEPQKGVYRFDIIDKDLAILKGMGKRLMIELWTTQYGGNVSTNYFPQWMIDEGGAGNIQNAGCCTVQLQQAYWMDRMILLVQALGAKYNADPYVEQFQTNETTATPSGQYIRLIEPMAKAWPNTVTVLFANWVDSPQMARDLVAKAFQFGVGIGGPDILPTGMNYGDDHGASVVRGRGVVTDGGWSGDFGSTDYRGKIPLSYQYQLIGHSITPTIAIAYAKVLGMTHIGWTKADSKNYDENTTDMLWPGVLASVSAANGWINTACPTVYAARCSTN